MFVGIYRQPHGWIAPGEDVSGLEDGYRLAGDLPQLICVKEPASEAWALVADVLAAHDPGRC